MSNENKESIDLDYEIDYEKLRQIVEYMKMWEKIGSHFPKISTEGQKAFFDLPYSSQLAKWIDTYLVGELPEVVVEDGYVWKYSIRLLTPKQVVEYTEDEDKLEEYADEYTYFKVTITNEKGDIRSGIREFKLLRLDKFEDCEVDNHGKRYAITTAPIAMAMVAMIKEAFTHGQRVKLWGQKKKHKFTYLKQMGTWLVPTELIGPDFLELFKVEILHEVEE